MTRQEIIDAVARGESLEDANLYGANLEDANLEDANLYGANLYGANLRGAYLYGANLGGAYLRGATLPTGEIWETYLSETVPSLLTAGGKAIESFTKPWTCNTWGNCPMAHAFDTNSLNGVPVLLRPRAKQFIQFFDAGLIPCPVTEGDK